MRQKNPPKFLGFLPRWTIFFCGFVLAGRFPSVNACPQSGGLQPDTLSVIIQLKLQLSTIDRKLISLSDSNLAGEVRLFKKMALQALDDGDSNLAQIYVQSALDILAPPPGPSKMSAGQTEIRATPIFQNQWRVSSGMDVSRQDFEITYSGRDSNLIDATQNPFVGFSLDGLGKIGERTNLNWNGSVRLSRDYTLGDFHASGDLPLHQNQNLTIWTDWEGMGYRREFEMKYVQGLGGIQWQANWKDKINALCEYEISYRRYDKPDQNFPNYSRRRFWGYVQFFPPLVRWMRLSAEMENRRHQQFSKLDYSQKRISLRSYFVLKRSELTLQIDRRFLNDNSTPLDSLYFLGSYHDWYGSFLLKQPLGGPFAFKLSTMNVQRRYSPVNTYLVDYDYLTAVSAVSWSPSSNFTIDLGYLFIQKRYRHREIEGANWAVKDYTVRGVQVGIDFLNFRNLLISGQISYEMRRHPNGEEGDTEGFNLYTNQNETAAMLFASWQFWAHYELDVVLHNDTAIDQELEHNNSRVSIFTLELHRKF